MTFHFPQPIQFLNPARILRPGLTWYALISKSAREARAANWLEQDYGDCMTLVPLDKRFRTQGRKGGSRHFRRVNAEYQIPLMARYVFAGFASHPNWLTIFESPHITGAISLHGEPIRIPEVQIERFRSHAESDRVAAGLPVLKIGSQAVFVGEGVFTGHLLEIADLGATSAEVWFDMFGSRRKVKVSREDLEAA